MLGGGAGTLQRVARLWGSIAERLDFEAKRHEAGFRELRGRFYRAYWGDVARAIGAEIEDLGQGYLRIRREGQWTFVRGSAVQLDDHLTLKLAGNKPLTNRLLAEYGYPAPRFCEFGLSELESAERFAAELGVPTVVKPASGTGGGNGVSMGIETPRKLRKAAIKAASYHPDLMIEEQVAGSSYRLLYLNGEFVDAVRRDPPRVLGDGTSSIEALIRAETERRLTAERVVALSPLTRDLGVAAALSAQGLTLQSVPERDTSVLVKTVVNQNAARENHCVREEVHPSIVQMGREIVTLFGIELGGLDLLTSDIAVPLDQSGGVINEVNTTPGIHHHVLVAEESKTMPVGEMILEYIFGRAQQRQAVALAAEQVTQS